MKKRNLFFLSLTADIIAAYLFLAVFAVAFYIYNKETLGPIGNEEYPELIRGFLRFATANICYTFGLFAAFALFPAPQKFYSDKSYRTICAILYIIGIVVMTATNLSDAVYFHYTAKRFTATEMFFLNNSNSLQLVFQFLGENLIMVAIGLASIAVWTYIYFSTRSNHAVFRNNTIHYSVHTGLFLLLAFCIVVGMRGGIDRQTRPITLSNAAQYSTTPQKGAIILSNPFCILRTIENKPSLRPRYFTSSPFSTTRDYTGDSLTAPSQRGKNVVIFILESFSAEHSAKLYPELYSKPLTPFIDSLMSEGYILRHAYANGHKSIDALPSVLASIPSLDMPFATLPEALSPTDALGTILKDKGYSTWFFNGSERGSMGYVAYSRIAGIENFRTKEDYEASHGNNDFDGYWGIWDEPFFNFMGETLDTVSTPFLSVIFTLSSHHPFVVPEGYEHLPEGFTKVHKPVAYVDQALRKFFERSKDKQWFDSTLFVFVADHVSSEKYGNAASTSSGGTHITAFYYTPDGSIRGEYTGTTQQIDIMPSIASLMGVDRPIHCYGRSIFTSKDTVGFAVNYDGGDFQWIQKDTAFLFDGENIVSVYDIKNDPEQLKNIHHEDGTAVETRIKAFLQTYYDEIKEKKFTVHQPVPQSSSDEEQKK